jgi:hypothetical protein
MQSSTLEMQTHRHGQHHDRPGESEKGLDDGTYSPVDTDVRPTSDSTLQRTATMDVEPLPAVTKTDDDPIVESSLHSLTESLDDDAISFITSMKYS